MATVTNTTVDEGAAAGDYRVGGYKIGARQVFMAIVILLKYGYIIVKALCLLYNLKINVNQCVMFRELM